MFVSASASSERQTSGHIIHDGQQATRAQPVNRNLGLNDMDEGPGPQHHDGLVCRTRLPDLFRELPGSWDPRANPHGCLAHPLPTRSVGSRSPPRRPHARLSTHRDGSGVFLDHVLRLGRPRQATNPTAPHPDGLREHNERGPTLRPSGRQEEHQ